MDWAAFIALNVDQAFLLLEEGGGTFWDGLIDPLGKFAKGTNRFSWPYLLLMIAIAYGCFLYQRSPGQNGGLRNFAAFLQIRKVYLHPSSLVDYRYWLLNSGLKALLVSPIILSSVPVSYLATDAVEWLLEPAYEMYEPTIPALVGYGLIVLLVTDLSSYLSHRLHHAIPYLWELHKVHHSAEVLNPTTAKRIHPIESLINASFFSIFSGTLVGIALYFWRDIYAYELFGINIFVIFTNSVSGNLRHSHVWFSYGKWLEHIFSSSAQHQIHHSTDPRHLDKNFAIHFSLWDYLFGTLYITTAKPEKLTFGIGEEGKNFNGVVALWVYPLRKILGGLRAG